MPQEKRSERRTSVDMVLNKYINGEPHLCRAINLSRGGMLLRKIFEPSVPHDRVILEFQLPGCHQIIRAEAVALMAGVASKTVGVRFTKMSADANELLMRYLTGPTEHLSASGRA